MSRTTKCKSYILHVYNSTSQLLFGERLWLNQSRAQLLVLITVTVLTFISFFLSLVYTFVSDNPCVIPAFDPYDKSMLKYIEERDPIVCSTHDPLTYTSLEEGRQVLRIREDAVHHYTTSLEQLDCCYSVITRDTDYANKESSCYKFNRNATLDNEVEFLYVECTHKKTNEVLYKNMHAVFQIKSPLTNVPVRSNDTGGVNEHLPNVYLLGIDGISRLNLQRTMPKTVAHLLANNWVELRKYNKVADNTYPNFMAILTGKTGEQLHPISCWKNPGTYHDHCPFIWKDFKQNGYLTSYAEDEAGTSTFTWNTDYYGFIDSPTDYYFRPFVVSAEDKLELVQRSRNYVCLGPASTTDIFLKYTTDLLISVRQSLFALTWLNNFSHDDFNLPAVMDDTFLKYMQDLNTTGIQNNTIVVFLSDHGHRFGGMVHDTVQGWLEDKLPFMFIWVPEWFREKYPDAYQHLVDNGGKLTSPYDLHLMLKDLADGRVGKNNAGTEACPTCVSLFTPVADPRSCDGAGIPTEWCACV